MTPGDVLSDSAQELFEDAPCGYLTTRLDGTILRVNRTFEDWTGHRREALIGERRFDQLLTGGGRIYHETHYAPLLHMQGSVREIALDIVRADGTTLPALINSVVREDAAGESIVRTTVFDATERRSYEQELLHARQREHDIALELQRSLLSGELPEDERLRTEVVYRPAEAGLEVGGDWYDAFWLETGTTVGVVVGDVVGRGIGAAATMGQLRSAVRALASTGLPPGAVLEALDSYVRRHGVGQMATVAYAEIDVATRRIRYACAGHPPPALVEPGHGARYLWDGRSPPLDVHATPQPRGQSTVVADAGSALVLYTDGLVERRDQPVPIWMDELLATLDRVSAAPETLVGLMDAVAQELFDAEAAADDVCVVAVHLGEAASAREA